MRCGPLVESTDTDVCVCVCVCVCVTQSQERARLQLASIPAFLSIPDASNKAHTAAQKPLRFADASTDEKLLQGVKKLLNDLRQVRVYVCVCVCVCVCARTSA